MIPRRVWLASLVVLSVALHPSTSIAQHARVLVLPTRTVGFIPNQERWQERFRDEVAAAFTDRAGIEVAPLSPLTPVELACTQIDCMRSLARNKAVDGVVWSSATIAGTHYTLAVGMYLAGAMRPPMSGDSESGEVGAAKTLRKLATFVAADGMPVLAHPAEAVHVEPTAPAPTVAVVPPPALTPPAAVVQPHSQTALVVGTVLTGAVAVGGIVLAGFGGAVVHDDGRSTCKGSPASSCPTVYDTKGPGAAMLATGIAVAVGAAIGVGFEVRALRRRSSVHASVAPAVGAGAAGVVVGGQW